MCVLPCERHVSSVVPIFSKPGHPLNRAAGVAVSFVKPARDTLWTFTCSRLALFPLCDNNIASAYGIYLSNKGKAEDGFWVAEPAMFNLQAN